MGDHSPAGRFSPAPGIYIDRTGNRTEITGTMQLYGPEATAARARSVMTAINNTWTATFPDGYSVRCRVTVSYRSDSTPARRCAD